MGNAPFVLSLPQSPGSVVVSTRSDPVHGFVVVRELSLVVANSATFTRGNGEKNRLEQVLDLARSECARMGGNHVLGATFEIKQFGERGGFMCYTMTGMACVVGRVTTTTSSSSSSVPVPIVSAVPVPNGGAPKTRATTVVNSTYIPRSGKLVDHDWGDA